MRRSFLVTIPATDLSLLTVEQLRISAGLDPDDDSQDEALMEMGVALSTDIAKACKINGDGIHPLTLCSETVEETTWYEGAQSEIVLSRRFVTEIISISDGGIDLIDGTDYFLDAEAGVLYRTFTDGRSWLWYPRRLMSITYVAGLLPPIPADLAAAAIDLGRFRTAIASANPLEKGHEVEIPGVRRIKSDLWVGTVPGSANGAVPDAVQSRIGFYASEPLIGWT